jgi:anti-sigma factor RsiW
VTDPHWDGEASVRDREVSVEDSASPLHSSSSELTHHELRAHLSDYLDGSMSPGVRRRVDAHLEQCPNCRAFRDTLRQTIHALDSLSHHRAPAEAKDRLRDRLQAQPAKT